jgi:choline kinase
MKAVILAAGMGLRFGTITNSLPKALVPVRGRPLISYILDLCEGESLEEIIIVGGYEFYELEAELEKRPTPYRLIRNLDYRKGNLLTLTKAIPYLDGDFFLANVDHIYPRSLFRKFLQTEGEVVAGCDFDRRLSTDDMKIRLDGNAHLTAIRKDLRVFDGGYIGLTRCSKQSLVNYCRAVEATLSRCGDRASVEQVLETLILWGSPPVISNLSGFGWWEVDNEPERRAAELALSSS